MDVDQKFLILINFAMYGTMDMDQKFLILICNVWSDGHGSEISDPYSFCVMEMDLFYVDPWTWS